MEWAGFGIGDVLAGALLSVATFGIGWALRGWFNIGAMERDTMGAELMSLRAALADSEILCRKQAEWVAELEQELHILRGFDLSAPAPKRNRPRLAWRRSEDQAIQRA
jgi:hypothetical protein